MTILTNTTYFFSSESVGEGHPDKMADQISDAVLDTIIGSDKRARVAVETFLTTGLALVGGEVHTNVYVEIRDIVQKVVKDIGYTDPSYGFHPDVAILSATDWFNDVFHYIFAYFLIRWIWVMLSSYDHGVYTKWFVGCSVIFNGYLTLGIWS